MLREDERGKRIIKSETFTNGNTLDGAKGTIETKWLIKNKK
jgi:hypothetical protein